MQQNDVIGATAVHGPQGPQILPAFLRVGEREEPESIVLFERLHTERCAGVRRRQRVRLAGHPVRVEAVTYAARRRWRRSLASIGLWSAQGGDVGGWGGSLRMVWPVGVVVMTPMPSGAVRVVQPAAILV